MAPSTVFRWLQGDRAPTGKGLRRLLEWAERLDGKATRGDVLSEGLADMDQLIALAQRETAGNMVRLSRIHGYAEAVLEMLEGVTERQRRVVNSLATWAEVEEDVEVRRLRAELDATSERPEATPPAPAAPRRKARGQ